MMTSFWTLVAALVFFTAPVSGGSVEEFYKGKTIRIVVGFGPGGATDTISRLLQRALSKHIPGSPSVVVENKPGGGSMLALNTVYNAGKIARRRFRSWPETFGQRRRWRPRTTTPADLR